MNHFYGSLQGTQNVVSRCGTKASGMSTVCASRQGAVECSAYHHDGIDKVSINFIPWKGHGSKQVIYNGPIDPIQEPTP